MEEKTKQHVILLVDDEPNVLAALQRVLHKEPYEVLTANSGTEALILLAEREVDLVVADQDMPILTGTMFLAEVRRKYPETVRYILTGKASLEVAVDAINAGEVARFLMKPIDENEFRLVIREGLRQKDLMAEVRRLLQVTRLQSAVLDQLESEHPEIIGLVRELSEEQQLGHDVDKLIKAIQDELGRADHYPWLPGRRLR